MSNCHALLTKHNIDYFFKCAWCKYTSNSYIDFCLGCVLSDDANLACKNCVGKFPGCRQSLHQTLTKDRFYDLMERIADGGFYYTFVKNCSSERSLSVCVTEQSINRYFTVPPLSARCFACTSESGITFMAERAIWLYPLEGKLTNRTPGGIYSLHPSDTAFNSLYFECFANLTRDDSIDLRWLSIVDQQAGRFSTLKLQTEKKSSMPIQTSAVIQRPHGSYRSWSDAKKRLNNQRRQMRVTNNSDDDNDDNDNFFAKRPRTQRPSSIAPPPPSPSTDNIVEKLQADAVYLEEERKYLAELAELNKAHRARSTPTTQTGPSTTITKLITKTITGPPLTPATPRKRVLRKKKIAPPPSPEQDIDRAEECSICMNAAAVMKNDNCTHTIFCTNCAVLYIENKSNTVSSMSKLSCPMCRAEITGLSMNIGRVQQNKTNKNS